MSLLFNSYLFSLFALEGSQHFPETKRRRIQTSYKLYKALDPVDGFSRQFQVSTSRQIACAKPFHICQRFETKICP